MEAVKALTREIEAARAASVQSRATDENPETPLGILSWMVAAGEIVSPWWSPRRDADLRSFWKGNDYIASAVYTLRTKVTTLPFQIIAKDPAVRGHVRSAAKFERMLRDADFGEGWDVAIGKFIEDVLTQDNGGFLEVIGGGDPTGPIEGPALGIAHLDAARCQRTGHPEYPVIYYDTDGQRYMYHYTRVIAFSQMSSPQVEMNGVGFCALSRAINTAQHLTDISIYEQEKLGSRPARQMLIGSGISSEEIMNAFMLAENEMDAQNLNRYSRIVVVGAKNRDVRLDNINLANVPDGFNKEADITLGLFSIAFAFGVDAREFWPATASGATKADAMVQHLKARGKAFGSVVEKLRSEIQRKVLPVYLELNFDQQDDEQDAQKAEIVEKRSQSRQRDIQSGVITERAARLQMLEDGEISESTFAEMELDDGRLPDGQPLDTLFDSPDPEVRRMLNGVEPDTDDEATLSESIRRANVELYNARNTEERTRIEQVLVLLRRMKDDLAGVSAPIDTNTPNPPQNALAGAVRGVAANGDPSTVTENQEKGYTIAEIQAMAAAAARVLSRGGE